MAIQWGLPLDQYHSAAHVTKSKLSDFAAKGPRFYATRYVQRTAQRDESSDAQVIGQALEDRIQVPAEYKARYVVRPDGMDGRTKEGKVWAADVKARGLVVLSADDANMIEEMVTAIFENEAAAELVRNAKPQPTITMDYAGLPGVASRPDWFSESGCALTGFRPYVLDLKSTLTLTKLTSGRGIAEYGYHQQFGLCTYALAKNGFVDVPVYLLAAEKCRPHRAQVVQLDETWLSAGWDWCARQLSKLAKHYQANEWPRVDAEMVVSKAPAWLANRVEFDEEAA